MHPARRILFLILGRPLRLVPALRPLSGVDRRRFLEHLAAYGQWREVRLAALSASMITAAPTAFTVAVACLAMGFSLPQAAAPALLAAFLAGRIGRTVVLHAGLTDAAAARLLGPACPRCRAPASPAATDADGINTCPRCARRVVDPAHLRSADQLISCDRRDDTRWKLLAPDAADCPCGYHLAGLPRVDNVTTCPECALNLVRQDPSSPPPLTPPSASPSAASSPSSASARSPASSTASS